MTTKEELVSQILDMGLESNFYMKKAPKTSFGYLVEQNPYELADLIVYLRDKFPSGIKRYMEIGIAAAGFTRIIAELVGISNAILIDNDSWQADKRDENMAEVKKRASVIKITNDSKSEDVRAELINIYSELAPNFVMIDGDHSYNGVMGDIETVLQVADKNTVIAMHDVSSNKDPGVAEAMNKAIDDKKLEMVQVFQAIEDGLGIAILRKVI